MSKNPTGPLWDNPASDEPAFPGLENVTEEQIREVMKTMDWEAIEREIEERTRPYRTKITAESLYRILD